MSKITQYIATHRKAVAGAVLTGLGAGLATQIAGATWQVIVVAVVGGALGVGAIPNAKAKPKG